MKRSIAMTGLRAVGAAMRAALASLDFFASALTEIVRIEGPAGEAKIQLKNQVII